MSVSKDRINDLICVYKLMYPDKIEEEVERIIFESNIGRSLLEHNQSVIHDDIVVNLCDIIEEKTGNVVDNETMDLIIGSCNDFYRTKDYVSDNNGAVKKRFDKMSYNERNKVKKILRNDQKTMLSISISRSYDR